MLFVIEVSDESWLTLRWQIGFILEGFGTLIFLRGDNERLRLFIGLKGDKKLIQGDLIFLGCLERLGLIAKTQTRSSSEISLLFVSSDILLNHTHSHLCFKR